MKVKDNLGWQRFFRMAKEWGIMAVLMIVLHLLFILGFVLLEPSTNLTAYAVLALIYVVGLIVILALFYRRLGRADAPLEYREAYAQGKLATAQVLEIEKTGWHSGRRNRPGYTISFNPFAVRPRQTKYEYQMRLRVMNPDEPEYEAQLAEYLAHNQIPQQGDTVAVKVHPQHPEIVVLAQE